MVEQGYEYTTNEIIDEFAKTIEMFDLTPLESRLFAYLYMSNEPKTLDGMSEATGKSKTSMSTSIRRLTDDNLVTRVWKKGERKDLYESTDDLFDTFMETYAKKWLETVNHQRRSLERIAVDFHADEVPEALNDIIAFHFQLEKTFQGFLGPDH